MLLASKYPFTCKVCGKSGKAGEKVSWVRGVTGVAHSLCSVEGRTLAAKVAASHARDAQGTFPAPVGKSYLPFQRAGISYALQRDCTLIADEMGLGKTIQAIGFINASPEIKRILVVCPASLKFNWRNEISAWHNAPVSPDWSPTKWGFVGNCNQTGREFYIINYDVLHKLNDEFQWDLMICDEFHYCKNSKAKRTQEVMKRAQTSKRVIGLTGTPVANKPVELFSLLQILKQDLAKKFTTFAYRYCNPQKVWTGRKFVTSFDGASNLDELQEKLRESCMVRREKADVLTELPAKRRQIVTLDSVKDDGLYSEFINEENYEETVSKLRRGAKIPFEEISKTRQEQALAKLPKALEFIKETINGGINKVVVFAHHVDVIKGLQAGLSEFGCVTISGDTTNEERANAVSEFQTNGACKVFIGSIIAAGMGLTLTAASTVIFVELDWTPGNVTQAEDRCHRIGQKDSVNVYHLVVDGTLDAKLCKVLVKKQEVISQALNGSPPVYDDLQFKSCTCLAADEYDHATWCDMYEKKLVSDEYVQEYADKSIPRNTPKISEKEIAVIHDALKILASRCDGAVSPDGQGFNRLDATFGKRLAACEQLTEKQALAARRMLKKYVRQIGEV